MQTERKGRPLRYGAKLRTVQVTLDAESIRKGNELGAGNLSAGIRAALSRPVDAAADNPSVPPVVSSQI